MDSIDLFSVKSEITLSTNDFKHFIFHSFKYTHYFLSKKMIYFITLWHTFCKASHESVPYIEQQLNWICEQQDNP